MKRAILVILVSLSLLAAPALAGTDQPQSFCPVMGGKINKSLYSDYQGKRVYFCCGWCIGEFNKDPEKYLKKLEEQGVAPEKAPPAPQSGTAEKNKK